MLNNNPVLVARHFQYHVEVFFKEIIIDGPLGKTKYYAIRVEFQVRGSPHVHCFLWVLKCTVFNCFHQRRGHSLDKIVHAFLPDKAENPELRGLVTFYQLQIHSKTCRKYKNEACKLNFGKCFTIQTITTEPLPEDLPLEVKILVLEKQKDILMKVKDYINNCLNPSKIKLFNHSRD